MPQLGSRIRDYHYHRTIWSPSGGSIIRLIRSPAVDLPHFLLDALERPGLDKGTDCDDVVSRSTRVIPVNDFVKELLVPWAHVLHSKPIRARTSESDEAWNILSSIQESISITSSNSVPAKSLTDNILGVLSLVGQPPSARIINMASMWSSLFFTGTTFCGRKLFQHSSSK
jgi:hypothetical protein